MGEPSRSVQTGANGASALVQSSQTSAAPEVLDDAMGYYARQSRADNTGRAYRAMALR